MITAQKANLEEAHMENNMFRYACILGVLIAAILCCLAWVTWAIFFRTTPAEISADAIFVKEVIRYAPI